MSFRPIAKSLVFVSFVTLAYGEELSVPDPATIEYPDGHAPSKLEVDLGKTLFFDTRLSINGKQSCASCHNPNLGFSDGMAKGHGTMGKGLGRNTPSCYNLAWNSVFFWDGRAGSLEEQALGPIQSPGEMNMPLDTLLPRLKRVAWYQATFGAVYGGKDAINKENVARAIASFERTLVTSNSPFDKYMKGDKTAMIPDAVRGMELFKGKANCVACHSGANFTDESFHNIGLGDGDIGRSKIVPGPTMVGAFKTPGLRNVGLSGPYMHDGSEGSLEAVVRFYNKGGNTAAGRDKLIKPLNLADNEIEDLVAFLGSLNDPLTVNAPAIPKDDDNRVGMKR
jgi:cytochrome c peroxidase